MFDMQFVTLGVPDMVAAMFVSRNYKRLKTDFNLHL